MPSIRNIIIFISIAAILVISYVVFIKKDEPADSLVASPAETLPDVVGGGVAPLPLNSPVEAADFLNLLLSVKNIKLDDSIFQEAAWATLVDSSIELVPSGDEGRPNPFAPLGSDVVAPAPAEPAPAPQANPASSSAPSANSGPVQ